MESNFKKLVRNLRTKSYEKVNLRRVDDIVNEGEKGKESKIQSDDNNN
jgi:hypothetical protein